MSRKDRKLPRAHGAEVGQFHVSASITSIESHERYQAMWGEGISGCQVDLSSVPVRL